ncbi:MAG: hypothetical protein EXR81_01125 [Gammaproteobacteria bacterium]|nr:hypothetical protein [Gammaproteobacteria bacterium]
MFQDFSFTPPKEIFKQLRENYPTPDLTPAKPAMKMDSKMNMEDMTMDMNDEDMKSTDTMSMTKKPKNGMPMIWIN